MPKELEKRMKDLSIHPKATKGSLKKKSTVKRRCEYWVYGFHLKNRYVRRLCEKFGLAYQTRPLSSLMRIQTHLIYACGVPYEWKSMLHRGKLADFLVFVEDDGRKREHLNRFTEEQMDRVRIELLLPEGTKPKWYDVNDRCEDQDDLSSEDEEMPWNPNEFPSNVREEVVPEKSSDEPGQEELEESDEVYISDDFEDIYGLFRSDEESDTESDTDESGVASGSQVQVAI